MLLSISRSRPIMRILLEGSARVGMADIGNMVMPWQWYLMSIDPEGTLPLAEVRAEVKRQAKRFYHLVVTITNCSMPRTSTSRFISYGGRLDGELWTRSGSTRTHR